MSGTDSLNAFFEHYYRRRPVSATLTGIHDHDGSLPDWSPAGLEAMDAEMRECSIALVREHAPHNGSLATQRDADSMDASLSRDYLHIQLAENAGGHGVRRNPALWTGEAAFGLVSLIIRDFAPLDTRFESAARRVEAFPAFFEAARLTLGDSGAGIPAGWTAQALRECEAIRLLLESGIPRWIGVVTPAPANRLRSAARPALAALTSFADWLRAHPVADDGTTAAGADYYDLVLTSGHRTSRSRADLLAEARERFLAARRRLEEMSLQLGGDWPAARERMAAEHPGPAEYMSSFGGVWQACRESAVANDLVSWPNWPIRYVNYPDATRDSAPLLYYLHYRSPAPFDAYTTHDYVVPELPAEAEAHLRVWNNSVIKLNHVVHHGAIGHHVQNWFAANRSRSRIGQVAAVDCASRIGMFCGATMAEGWASYVGSVMDEVGFLTPLDQLSEQHTRMRALARTIVDIEMHQGTMSPADGVAFYMHEVGMAQAASQGEANKNLMFPGTAIAYWLGAQGIQDLRAELTRRRGPSWSLRAFHDEFLSHGSIPVPLIADMMSKPLPEVREHRAPSPVAR